MSTLGLHLIWTTYGTWLPGDDRGNWSALLDLWGGYLGKRHTENGGDERTGMRAIALLKGERVVLSDEEQNLIATIVAETIGETVIRALAIEPTHVHLQIDPLHVAIGTFAGRVKGKSSSAVLDKRPSACHRRVWTAGYCVKYLDHPDALIAVQDYIEQHNVDRGLPPAPWDFIRRKW